MSFQFFSPATSAKEGCHSRNLRATCLICSTVAFAFSTPVLRPSSKYFLRMNSGGTPSPQALTFATTNCRNNQQCKEAHNSRDTALAQHWRSKRPHKHTKGSTSKRIGASKQPLAAGAGSRHWQQQLIQQHLAATPVDNFGQQH